MDTEVKQRVNKSTVESYLDEIVVNLNDGDFIDRVDGPNGSSFLVMSLDPIKMDITKQSIIRFKKPIEFPGYVESENSISVRNRGVVFSCECNDGVPTGVTYPEIAVSKLAQAPVSSVNTVTITLASPYNGFIGDWIDVYSINGVNTNNILYGNLVIKQISTSKLILTCTYANEATLQTVTVAEYTTTDIVIRKQNRLVPYKNAIGIRYSGNSATALSPFTKFNNGSIKVGGTLSAGQIVSCVTTAPVFNGAISGQVDLKSSNRYKFELDGENAMWYNFSVDAPSLETNIASFSSVRPNLENTKYYLTYRGFYSPTASKPICRVKSISKPISSTTATVLTDVPHGLKVGSTVKIYGVRDVTNFAPTVATVVTVATTTTFTVAYGAAPAAATTSYGGFVAAINGSIDIDGLVTGTVQTSQRDSNGYVTLRATAAWSGYVGIGEYVELYGCIKSNGTDMLLDGTYQVNDVNTTTFDIILEPVKDPLGVVVKNGLGNNVTPTGTAIPVENTGGYLIVRPTLRVHDQVASSYSQTRVLIAGQGTTNLTYALPIIPASGSSLTANIGTPTTPSTSTINVAATTNATVIKSSAGNLYGIQVSNTVGATMYLKLYNKATAPTVGTDIPVLTIPIPTTAGSLLALDGHAIGYRFSAGISIAITNGLADNDTAVVSTAGAKLMMSYY